jgi:thiol-disulfide isomerase/thioredoxin
MCIRDRLLTYRGKPVYLHFFTTWNVASLEEMEFMRKLHTKYADSVQFISICCDREYMKMYHFVRDQKIPWPVVHFNNDYEMLESLDVKTYPYFILLDAEGRYIANPAESPSGNIEGRLNHVLHGHR